MEKTVNLGEKKVKLNNSVGWTLIYRNQFGRDIVPSLMPILMSALDMVGGIINEAGSKNTLGLSEIAAVIGSDAYVDAMVHLSGIELTEILYIAWAMAKNADDTVEDPETWIKSLDTFPLDEMAPVLFNLIAKGFMSSKNLKRLQTMTESLKPSTSTQSSLQDSKED